VSVQPLCAPGRSLVRFARSCTAAKTAVQNVPVIFAVVLDVGLDLAVELLEPGFPPGLFGVQVGAGRRTAPTVDGEPPSVKPSGTSNLRILRGSQSPGRRNPEASLATARPPTLLILV
jgi:hypothetical protein